MNESSQISALLRHRLAPLAVRAVVGVSLLAFVFSRGADLRHVLEIVRRADVVLLLAALGIAVTGELITAWKWALLVRFGGGVLPYGVAVRASLIGMFYNNFLPGSVGGDVVRVLLIARYAGGKAKAAASAFMQRNTGLAGLFAIGIPAAILWPLMIDFPVFAGERTLFAWPHDCRFWLISAAVGYCTVNVIMFSRTAYDRAWSLLGLNRDGVSAGGARQPGFIGGIRKTLVLFFQKLRRFHTELHGSRFWEARPLRLSVLTQLIDIMMVWTLSRGLGLDVPLEVLMVAVPMVTLANLLPVTVNGIGLREFMYVALLSGTGVAASQAVALSLMQFGVIVVLSGVGGILQWGSFQNEF